MSCLLEGKKRICDNVIDELLEKNVPLIPLYQQLFRPSLYKIGELWEFNKISVATEHMATSIVESLMNRVYANVPLEKRVDNKIVITTVESELHQIGAKMAADISEISGWDSYFLGASVPTQELLRFLHQTKPEVVGLSLSVYFNLDNLEKMIAAIKKEFDQMKILIGGQAFLHGGTDIVDSYSNLYYLPDLNELKQYLEKNFQPD
jgi:methanogenic corrinoid protein MtbC1